MFETTDRTHSSAYLGLGWSTRRIVQGVAPLQGRDSDCVIRGGIRFDSSHRATFQTILLSIFEEQKRLEKSAASNRHIASP